MSELFTATSGTDTARISGDTNMISFSTTKVFVKLMNLLETHIHRTSRQFERNEWRSAKIAFDFEGYRVGHHGPLL